MKSLSFSFRFCFPPPFPPFAWGILNTVEEDLSKTTKRGDRGRGLWWRSAFLEKEARKRRSRSRSREEKKIEINHKSFSPPLLFASFLSLAFVSPCFLATPLIESRDETVPQSALAPDRAPPIARGWEENADADDGDGVDEDAEHQPLRALFPRDSRSPCSLFYPLDQEQVIVLLFY